MIKMKEERKILSYLSDHLGSGGSILEMTNEINKRYGPAYYSNIYNTTKKLEKAGIIEIRHEGNSRLIKLLMENPISIYRMAEIEIYKAQSLDLAKELLSAIMEIAITQRYNILSICALGTQKHTKINRLELLVLIKDGREHGILESLLKLESTYNIKIDPVILTLRSFIKIMNSNELDFIKDLILDKNILYNGEGFWELIRQNRFDSKYKRLAKSPQELTRGELAYNYNRLGFRLNEEIHPANKISIELTIFSMSINEEIRIKYGAIILLSKNMDKINWNYLYYLYKRYDELGRLKGILHILVDLGFDGDGAIQYYSSIIKDTPEPFDNKIIKKYVELYG